MDLIQQYTSDDDVSDNEHRKENSNQIKKQNEDEEIFSQNNNDNSNNRCDEQIVGIDREQKENARPIGQLKLHEKFDSIQALEDCIAAFENATFTRFYKKDSLSIARCRKKNIKRKLNPALEFYSMRFFCVRGGRKFKTQSTGQRRSSTLQIGCKASFFVKQDAAGEKFEITQIDLQHNHDNSKELQRRFSQSKRRVSSLFNYKHTKDNIYLPDI